MEEGFEVIASDTPLPPAPLKADLANVLPYLLRVAGGEPGALRSRLYAAIVLLIAAKGLGIAAPLLFKDAVDALATAITTASPETSARSENGEARLAPGASGASTRATKHAPCGE